MSGYKSEAFYVKLDKAVQKDLCAKAIKQAGFEKKLCKLLKIPSSSFYAYKNALYKLPFFRFKRIIAYLRIPKCSISFELVDCNDSRRIGGKKAYEKSVSQGRFEEIHSKMRKASSKYMKNWHSKMKLTNKKQYYELQYSRFKKIGGYFTKTIRGDLVRNWLEREVADFLHSNGVSYEYEKLVLANNNVYFPDFVVGNIIIDCTYWKGLYKLPSLKKKISDLKKENFVVFIVIPKALASFYKPIENNIIYLEELGKQKIIANKVCVG